ncbi:hypothetical protein C8F04DRAFT_1093025 [Mycena alexandri]|uniref:BTB domain-containing protein n=1 Tax=Mycena alexandri TaxID=1745969 RepID=A0AAD6X700_9AGAR|nr:hypothetical protein C8F04DRAFT_1093025 [Mycena alexandri]
MAHAHDRPVSPKFNFPDADVVFKSSDGVLFRVHRKNLEVCTEGFPAGDISTLDEVIELTESSATLELLFRFMYPQRHPALDVTPFKILEPLAEASEKYQVFPAMNICHIRMRDMVNEHPVEVAVYAAKHDYPYLVSQVAPMMIAMDLVQVVGMLPGYLVLSWTKYLKEWMNVYHKIALFQGGRHSYDRCKGSAENSWSFYALGCMARLAPGVHTLRSLNHVFDTAPQMAAANHKLNSDRQISSIPQCCETDLQAWRRRIEDGIAKIPAFSTFL